MNVTSRTGGTVASVVVIWFVFAVTQSALDVTIVGVAQAVSTVAITLPSGVWVDRYNRRKLLLSSNAVRVACLALLALLTATTGFMLLPIVAIVFVHAAATELYRSTDHSVLPDLVNPEGVTNANGLTVAGYNLTGSASSALGGALIVVVGITSAFIYGAVSYALATIFSGFLFYRLRTPSIQKLETRNRSRMMAAEIKEGYNWLVTQRGLFLLSVSAVAFNFLFGMTSYFMVIYVSIALKAGAFLFGVILAVFVVGIALGSIIGGQTNAVAYAGKVWVLSNVGLGLLTLLLGAVPQVFVALAANFAVGLIIGFSNNVWLTSAQNLVPSPMRGRYFAIDGLLSFIGGPPSIAVGGILISAIGVLPVYELAGIIMVIFSAIFYLMRSLWRLDGRLKPKP